MGASLSNQRSLYKVDLPAHRTWAAKAISS
jgi:hypothetical protein